MAFQEIIIIMIMMIKNGAYEAVSTEVSKR